MENPRSESCGQISMDMPFSKADDDNDLCNALSNTNKFFNAV